MLEYAKAQTAGRQLFSIALVVNDPVDGLGLIWLSGMDPNDDVRSEWDLIRRNRMEARLANG